MKSLKKFKIVTLGCRTNQYESQAFQDQLSAMGFSPAINDESADICIVNTCTVTESADSSSRHAIRQLARQNPNSRIVVTGCYADRQAELIGQIEGVTDVIPNKDKERILEIIFPEENVPEFSIKNFDSHTRAFIKVQDGCNSFCTYCIIPYVRGRSKSRSVDEIVKEAEKLVFNGFKEIVLTGINVGDFDNGDGKNNLADLVRAIDKVEGIQRVRISSIDPDEVDENLMDAVLSGKNTCHSMHVVLQSGSNIILKRMNRKYTRQIFLQTIDRLRLASPSFTFTTDVIVGFPGETEEDFQETLEVIEEVQFANVHMFPYSDRPRTRSALYPNKVSPQVINSRRQTVLRRSEQVAFALRDQYRSQKMKVLTENKDSKRPNEIFGHTDNFLPVWIPSKDLEPNEIVEVELLENTPSGFVGKLYRNTLEN